MTEPTDNLQQRCAEIVEWQRTGVLSGSTLRNHAKTHWAGHHDSLQMAERDTFTKAVEWVAKWGTSPAVAGEPVAWRIDSQVVRGRYITFDEHPGLTYPNAQPLYTAPQPAPVAQSRTDDEREEDDYTIHRMGQMLAEIAVIIKGPERARHRHGYADLPALVMELAAFKQAVLDPENQPSQFGTTLFAAPAAQGDALPWLQANDMAALERFAETTDDDESYDIGKEAVQRLAGFGCLRSHGFGKYSITDFGHYVLNDWSLARELPFKSQSERGAARSQAKEGGA